MFLGAYGAASVKPLMLLANTEEIYALSTTRADAVAMLPVEESVAKLCMSLITACSVRIQL